MTDDEVFEGIRALVAQGEYRDQLFGKPGVALQGGGAFQQFGDEPMRRVYQRGTPAHLEARAAGLVDRLPDLRVASPQAIASAEKVVGHPLPRLLRRFYLEIGNGGFGPGHGLLGLDGGYTDGLRKNALSSREGWTSLPPGLLPICAWGCAIYSLVDCASPEGDMWAWDPNPVPDDEIASALFRQDVTFAGWIARWIAGRLYQPTLLQDPATGLWRGATDDELREMTDQE